MKTLDRTPLASRTSLDAVLSASPKEVTELLISAEFVDSEPIEPCKCDVPNWRLEEKKLQCAWRCKKCRKSVS